MSCKVKYNDIYYSEEEFKNLLLEKPEILFKISNDLSIKEIYKNPFGYSNPNSNIVKNTQEQEVIEQPIQNKEGILQKQNIFTVKPIQAADKKAIIKASVANKYIGFAEGIEGSSTAEYARQINEEYTKAVKEANSRPSTTNIPQNLQSGVEQYGTLQYANSEAQKMLGKNVSSIELIENGFRTRTTRTDKELDKYNIKVGSYIKMFGKDQFGNTKNVIVKIIKITKGYNDATWYKEGWTGEGLEKLKAHTNSANAVEFQVINQANSGNYNSNDVMFVSIGGKRGNETIRKEQQDKTIKEALKAIEAGATLITDNKSYVESSDYNEGEKRLAKNLEAKGYSYSEQTVDGQVLGVWDKFVEQPINKEIIPTQNLTPKDFINHSGGAYGGDTFWDIIGREFGFTNNKHYRDSGNTSLSKQLRDKGIKAEVLSKEQMDKARLEVEKLLGKKYPDTLQGNLQVRNYYQVANSDGVFAIAKLDTDKGFKSTSVLGGTNTAVQLGIKMNKPVYVWDVFTEKWHEYDSNTQQFEPTETPILTKNFAGVGSRDIENYQTKNKETGNWESRKEYVGKEKEEKAKQAIRDVYQKTLQSQEQPIVEENNEEEKDGCDSPL